MFGITAFPVKKPNSTPESQELLGIRIEIFNSTDLVFETPHYLILQKNLKNSKWDIYKHTIPNFIQVKTIAAENYDNLSEYQLFHFIMEIRDILNKVAIKHQIIDKLKRDLSKNIKNLEKDIPLEVLKFDLKIPKQVVTPVILNLSLESIESSHIERGFSETEKSRINNVLKGDIKSFQDRFHDVINSVSE
jgi:central kinetochore subunit Mal2/MCM21